MPIITKTITRNLQQPNVSVFTPTGTIPPGLNSVRMDMDLDPALLVDPTVACEVAIERSTLADPTTWRQLAAVTLVGNPLNSAQLPYVVVPGANIASLVGQNVRGRLKASVAMQLGAVLTIDFT